MPVHVSHDPDALPGAYAAWRHRTLAAALIATAVGFVVHGSTAELHVQFEDEQPSTWLVIGLLLVLIGTFSPGLVGACLALAGLRSWRRLGRSSRLARAAWVVWVLGPLPILLLPISHVFNLDAGDALRTSTSQVRYLVTVTAPAFFALLPGALKAALVLKRFLPESRAPGQITLLAAPACIAAYLIPLGVLTHLAFHIKPYLGLLLLTCSPVVSLLAVRWLRLRNTPEQAVRITRNIGVVQLVLACMGAGLLIAFVEEHPLLRSWVGQVDPIWVLGVVAKVLASKWLTTVVVTDLLVVMLHQEREAARALAGTGEGEALARKLDALGEALRPATTQHKVSQRY
ncbi:MAG: hypothetical protein C0467_07195 [Planctomycetaceae bacterium]|nr:hypothetical protein [Planctomycetaceae bacterium]